MGLLVQSNARVLFNQEPSSSSDWYSFRRPICYSAVESLLCLLLAAKFSRLLCALAFSGSWQHVSMRPKWRTSVREMTQAVEVMELQLAVKAGKSDISSSNRGQATNIQWLTTCLPTFSSSSSSSKQLSVKVVPKFHVCCQYAIRDTETGFGICTRIY